MQDDRGARKALKVRLRAHLFGEFRLETALGEAFALSNRRGALVVAILCLQPDNSMDRDALGKLLWPGRFAPQIKASLRQCLHELGRQLREDDLDLLQATRSTVALDKAAIGSDLQDLVELLARGRKEDAAERLLEIGNQPLMQGLSLNPAFDEWLAARRQHFDARIKAGIYAALTGANTAAKDAPKDAPKDAAKDATLDQRLVDAVRTRFPEFRTSAQSSARTGIAVLPFAQFDEVGGNFFLAEGVTDELSSQLARVAGIALVGRTSVSAVAGRGETLSEMATSLRVSHLIEGEVRRSADGIRVRLALIEGSSGTELWSDEIEGSIETFFDARKVIGANLIAAICRVLGLAITATPQRRMTPNREAYALYLQGRALTYRAIGDGVLAKAIELLEQALELDPDFAECWTALAEAHVNTAVYTPCLDRISQSEQMAKSAQRAISLNPDQGHARAMLAIHEWTCGNPVGALDLAFEAYRLEPSNPDVSMRLGSFLLYIGRTRDALPFIEAAIEQDPVFGRNFAMLATAHFNLGNIEQALAAGQRMVDLGMPGNWLAVMQSIAGDHERAVQTYFEQRLLMNTVILPPAGTKPMADAARDAYWSFAAKGLCSGSASDRAAYCAMLDGLHQSMPDPHDTTIVLPAIWMGHADLVMKIYRERIHPANMFCLMSLWADADPIRRTREHPGFIQFAEDIGLVEAWNRFGWPDLMPTDPRKG